MSISPPTDIGLDVLNNADPAVLEVAQAKLKAGQATAEAQRLASPFILFNVLFNMAIGFINKLAPIVPVYFISTPYMVMGGTILFYLGVASMLSLYADAFGPIFR